MTDRIERARAAALDAGNPVTQESRAWAIDRFLAALEAEGLWPPRELIVTEEAAMQFWNAMQEDGENFDFETCHERLKEFVAALTLAERE